MDIKAEREAAREAANVLPLRSKIYSFFSFEICLLIASVIIFSVHVSLKISDEKLLNEGIAVQGDITKKIKIRKTANKGKDNYYYEHSLRYRFTYYFGEYTGSNHVEPRLWNKVKEGDTILISVDSDNPERSRIKSSDVIIGIIPTLKILSINIFAIAVIFLVASRIIKKLRGKRI